MARRGRVEDTGYDPHASIPEVIPKVTFDSVSGEPIIAREEVHRPSPIPRSLAIVLLLLAALSVAYNAVQQVQRNDEQSRSNRDIQRQVTANKLLLDRYAHQQAIIDANEQRLEDLVLAISTAKSSTEVAAAIQRFLRQSAEARNQEQTYQQQQSTEPPRRSSSESPDSKSSPTPSKTRSASPKPTSSTSAMVCVQSIVCITPLPSPLSVDIRTELTGKSVSTPVTENDLLWYGVAGILTLTVGALYLVYGRHRRPLEVGITEPFRTHKEHG